MLKDWKKVGKDKWKKRNKTINVYKAKYGSGIWRFDVTTDYKNYSQNIYRESKTKAQAMKYAKAYIRKN